MQVGLVLHHRGVLPRGPQQTDRLGPFLSTHALTTDQRRLAAISMDALLDELAHRRWEKWAFGIATHPLGIAFVPSQ